MNTETSLNALIAIGKILEARETKFYISKKHKTSFKNAEARLASAKKDLSTFGMFEDCGTSYEAAYVEAVGFADGANASVNLVVSFEKHYKKLKHEFSEKFPEYLELLNSFLEKQTKEIEAKYRGKN